MQLVLSSGFTNVRIFPLTLPHFIGYPLILASSTNLHVFATTLCQLTLRPTSLTFLLFTPLPVSFAHVLTTLSSVVHLSVPYPIVKDLSHTPPLLLGTLFLSRSALLIVSLNALYQMYALNFKRILCSKTARANECGVNYVKIIVYQTAPRVDSTNQEQPAAYARE